MITLSEAPGSRYIAPGTPFWCFYYNVTGVGLSFAMGDLFSQDDLNALFGVARGAGNDLPLAAPEPPSVPAPADVGSVSEILDQDEIDKLLEMYRT